MHYSQLRPDTDVPNPFRGSLQRYEVCFQGMKEAIENLTDEEVEQFLHMKWIDPVIEGINGTLTAILNEMEKSITALGKKYAVSYNDLGQQLEEAQQELSELVSDLTGDEFALEGLQQLNK